MVGVAMLNIVVLSGLECGFQELWFGAPPLPLKCMLGFLGWVSMLLNMHNQDVNA